MYDVVSVLTRAYACRRDGWWHQLIEFIMVRLVLVTVLVLTSSPPGFPRTPPVVPTTIFLVAQLVAGDPGGWHWHCPLTSGAVAGWPGLTPLAGDLGDWHRHYPQLPVR